MTLFYKFSKCAAVLFLVFTLFFQSVYAKPALDRDGIYELLYDSLIDMKEEISLDGFILTREELREAFTYVYSRSPELFYVSSAYRFSATEKYVTVFVPIYLYNSGEIQLAGRTLEAFLRNTVAKIPQDSDSFEKAKYLHDFICDNFYYSESGGRDVFEFILQGCGVCQAYTGLYKLLLEYAGIECDVAESSDMGHIWNVVKLDGEWYHVDVTWDDTGNSDANFLKSDSEFLANGHRAWSCEFECKTKYEFSEDYSPDVNGDGCIDGLDIATAHGLGWDNDKLNRLRVDVGEIYINYINKIY